MANEKIIWDFLSKTFNPYAVAGIMGNLYAESALNPKNLQGSYEKKLGYDDEEYTTAVDNGSYKNFIKDQAGYGLAQWTYWSRKQNLLGYAKNTNRSIGDITMQLEFLLHELKEGYNASCYTPLLKASSVLEASNIILLKFERPKNQDKSVQKKRASYGEKYYNMFVNPPKEEEVKNIEKKQLKLGDRTLRKGTEGDDVKELQTALTSLGFELGAIDGKFGEKTFKAVKFFQRQNNLVVDGIFGNKSFAVLQKLQK